VEPVGDAVQHVAAQATQRVSVGRMMNTYTT